MRLSAKIIGAAMAVHHELGPGLDGKIYERSLVIERRKRQHRAERQRTFAVHCSGEWVGTLTPDTIADSIVVADPKIVEAFNDAHIRQMIGCLAITKLKLALLLNFKHARLQWKRIVREADE